MDEPILKRLQDLALVALVRVLLLLPFGLRVHLAGWIVAEVVGPIAGYRDRIDHNLTLVAPKLSELERQRLARAVMFNAGRTVIENLSVDCARALAAQTRISGPGVQVLDKLRKTGGPAVFVSGHFGNHDIGRGTLAADGHYVGALYRNLTRSGFNKIYVQSMAAVAEPIFLQDYGGMADMVRFLKLGGTLALLIDQHAPSGEKLTFFGKPAYTSLSAAELALKHNAPFIPMYCLRGPDGRSFELIVEDPIPHTTAVEMTQAFNDSLERRVRENMDQWLWIHRRWRMED